MIEPQGLSNGNLDALVDGSACIVKVRRSVRRTSPREHKKSPIPVTPILSALHALLGLQLLISPSYACLIHCGCFNHSQSSDLGLCHVVMEKEFDHRTWCRFHLSKRLSYTAAITLLRCAARLQGCKAAAKQRLIKDCALQLLEIS